MFIKSSDIILMVDYRSVHIWNIDKRVKRDVDIFSQNYCVIPMPTGNV